MLLFTNVLKHNDLPNGFIGQTFVMLKKIKCEQNLEKHVKAPIVHPKAQINRKPQTTSQLYTQMHVCKFQNLMDLKIKERENKGLKCLTGVGG